MQTTEKHLFCSHAAHLYTQNFRADSRTCSKEVLNKTRQQETIYSLEQLNTTGLWNIAKLSKARHAPALHWENFPRAVEHGALAAQTVSTEEVKSLNWVDWCSAVGLPFLNWDSLIFLLCFTRDRKAELLLAYMYKFNLTSLQVPKPP